MFIRKHKINHLRNLPTMVQIEYEKFKATLRTASKEGGIRNESMSSPTDHPAGVEVPMIVLLTVLLNLN